MGRSHGDVNSDSLLAPPVRCSIAKKHQEEWTTRPVLPLNPVPLTSCHASQRYSQSRQTWSGQTAFTKGVSGHVVWPHRNALQGQSEGKGGRERSLWIIKSDYLVTYGWWLSATAWSIVPSKNYTFSFLRCLFICLSPPDHLFSTVHSSLCLPCPCTGRFSD